MNCNLLKKESHLIFQIYFSDRNFLIAFSEKIKKYERMTNYHPEFVSWTDNFYKKIDDDLSKENYKGLTSLWKSFLKEKLNEFLKETNSVIAKKILDNFEVELKNFKQICPIEMLDKLDNPITLKSTIKKVS